MYLNEAKQGDVVIVKNLTNIDPIRRNSLRDMGLYEFGIAYVDGKDENSIFFHKDSLTLAVPLDEAERIEVRPYTRD